MLTLSFSLLSFFSLSFSRSLFFWFRVFSQLKLLYTEKDDNDDNAAADHDDEEDEDKVEDENGEKINNLKM